MTLKELVRLRTFLLGLIDDLKSTSEIEYKISKLNSFEFDYKDTTYFHSMSNLIQEFYDLISKNQTLVTKYYDIIRALELDIELYVKQNIASQVDKIDERFLPQNDDIANPVADNVYNKITHYNNFKFPSLIINPRNKRWIDATVAGDPLYLAGYDIDHIHQLISTYNPLYQRRLRIYNLQNGAMNKLPKNQFGFILSWDFFDYLTLESVNLYIEQAYQLLRPGGTFMFSYNNCEIEGSAARAEIFAAGYQTETLIVNQVRSLGYEIINSLNIPTGEALLSHVSWLEVKKPGELNTIKQSQALAKIIE